MLFFFYFITAYSITITREDAKTIFNQNNEKPTFVFLVSDYCPHCKKIKPIIKNLEEKYSQDSSLTIAKIECDYEKVLCNKFPDSSTPNFYWVKGSIENAEQYFGAQDLSEIIVFIEKKLSPQFINIHSKEEFLFESQKRNESSIFIFNRLNHNQLNAINSAQKEVINYPCYFFNISYTSSELNQSFFCNYYYPANKYICLKKQLTEKSIRKFILKHAYPKVGPISSQLVSHFKVTKTNILIFASEFQQFDELFIEMSRDYPDDLTITYLNCANNYKICFNLLIQPNAPQILMFNPSRKLIWRYHGEMDKDQILEWIGKVENNQIRATGPGAGFFGYLGNLFDLSREKGLFPFILFVCIICVFIFMFILGTVETIHRNRRNKKID